MGKVSVVVIVLHAAKVAFVVVTLFFRVCILSVYHGATQFQVVRRQHVRFAGGEVHVAVIIVFMSQCHINIVHSGNRTCIVQQLLEVIVVHTFMHFLQCSAGCVKLSIVGVIIECSTRFVYIGRSVYRSRQSRQESHRGKTVHCKGVSFAVVAGISYTSLLKFNASHSDELYVYNWGEYIDEDVIRQFEEETGIHVVYDLFETNEEMYPVIEAGAVQYDVVCPSDYMIQRMAENGLLAEINWENVPNISNIGQTYMEWSEAFDPGNLYSVPYCWGTVGILCNVERLEELGVPVPTKWADLWDPRLSGEILMQDSVRDAFMVAQKSLGYSLNSTDPGELSEAKDLLLLQKPLVQAYVVDQVRDKMLSGEAAVGVIYSGELLYLQEEAESLNLDFTLQYVLPEEGTNLWIDSWVIPWNARNKENAEKWINFLCRPDIAKKNFEYITYATPNEAAFRLLDPEYQQNADVFPDTSTLTTSEVYRYLGTEADDLYNALWKEVKSQ